MLQFVFFISALLSFGICLGGEIDKGNAAEIAGVTLTRTAEKPGRIEDRNIAVSDWAFRISNTSSEPRWVEIVEQKTKSNYLVVRNPEQISYLVLEKAGTKWRDTQIGWSVLLGRKDTWIAINPGASLDFIVPIFDRFRSSPALVRIEIKVATDEAKRNVKVLSSKTIEYKAEQASFEQPTTRSESKPEDDGKP